MNIYVCVYITIFFTNLHMISVTPRITSQVRIQFKKDINRWEININLRQLKEHWRENNEE